MSHRSRRTFASLVLGATLLLTVHVQALAGEQARLEAADGGEYESFGSAVAVDGDTAAVGAHCHPRVFCIGAVYVYARSGATWAQQDEVGAADGDTGDFFGHAVALDRDTLLVGAPGDDTPAGEGAGSAYVFVRSGTGWAQQAKLAAPGPAAFDRFGSAVALQGDLAFVGAPYDDLQVRNAGSVHVFARSGSSWAHQATLASSDVAQATDDAMFGAALSVDGDTLLVGSPRADAAMFGNDDRGVVFVFGRIGASWVEEARLTEEPEFCFTCEDRIGAAVALRGDLALVGAPSQDTEGGADAGNVFVFARQDGAWERQLDLRAYDAAAGDSFGGSLALDGARAVVGAAGVDAQERADAGAAYIAWQDPLGWSQAKVASSDAAEGDHFGTALALRGDTLLVGTPGDDRISGTNAGSATVFRLCGPDVPLAPAVPGLVCVALDQVGSAA